MTVTIDTIREIFPQFTTDAVSDAVVTYWLGYASRNINPLAWGEQYDDGIMLMTAHFLTINLQNKLNASEGLIPGVTTGIDTSQSGGGLSYSVDLHLTTEEGAGQWNATQYGVQYYQLSKVFGIGGTVVAGLDPRLDPGSGVGAGGFGYETFGALGSGGGF